jgi:hypothetical protein
VSGPRAAGDRRAAAIVALCAATLLAALALDRLDPLWGQIGAAFLTWGVAFALIGRADGVQRPMLFWCMVWATSAELFCSLVWGLYTYRLGNIPHFVPPGHVLLFLIGWHLAPRIPEAAAHALTATYAVLALAGLTLLGDEFSVVLFAVYAALYWREPALRGLLAAMFGLALAIELYGTSLGVWGWAARTPVLGLATTNPPVAVAAFYCTLDVLCVWSVRRRAERRSGDPLGDWRARFVERLTDNVDKRGLAGVGSSREHTP